MNSFLQRDCGSGRSSTSTHPEEQFILFSNFPGWSRRAILAMDSTSTELPPGATPTGAIRTRSKTPSITKRACDQCKFRKIKVGVLFLRSPLGSANPPPQCSLLQPCKACESMGFECTFLQPQKKRGPTGQ